MFKNASIKEICNPYICLYHVFLGHSPREHHKLFIQYLLFLFISEFIYSSLLKLTVL